MKQPKQKWYEYICIAWTILFLTGCQTRAKGTAVTQPSKVQDFEISFVAVQLMPNPGPRAECECDSTGKLRFQLDGEEPVNLKLDPHQTQAIAKAVHIYLRQPAPFIKRARVLDGGLTKLVVRSGEAVRVSVIQNWRMPHEGALLFDMIRRAAASARANEAQLKLIDASTGWLLRTNSPDDGDFEENPPVDVIPNAEPGKLVELLKNNRPHWVDDGEAHFLFEELARVSANIRPDDEKRSSSVKRQ